MTVQKENFGSDHSPRREFSARTAERLVTDYLGLLSNGSDSIAASGELRDVFEGISIENGLYDVAVLDMALQINRTLAVYGHQTQGMHSPNVIYPDNWEEIVTDYVQYPSLTDFSRIGQPNEPALSTAIRKIKQVAPGDKRIELMAHKFKHAELTDRLFNVQGPDSYYYEAQSHMQPEIDKERQAIDDIHSQLGMSYGKSGFIEA